MLPTGLQPLIDGDILRYEIGFGAETGWKAIKNDPEAIPPFYFVEEMLHMRLNNIKAMCNTDRQPEIFITEGRTFREDIAKLKPYKGTRKDSKPWHFRNLTAYLKGGLNATVVTGVEADDLMAIRHGADPNTIICSRDKDLKQVPGWHYSWELGLQPSFGPELITNEGSLHINTEKKPPKLTGTGLLFFYSQLLTGDTVDNIPGLPGCGPVAAHKILTQEDERSLYERVADAYTEHYGNDAESAMLEQGRLCWIVRRFKDDGSPEVWDHRLEH